MRSQSSAQIDRRRIGSDRAHLRAISGSAVRHRRAGLEKFGEFVYRCAPRRLFVCSADMESFGS
jgi:hypothetical protein